jgi:four helix bundle protein
MLAFQRLDVYRCAVQFLALTAQLPAATTKGQSSLIDQLRRAATSISLNIAEASGRTGAADRARCLAIARGSAMECAAALDALATLSVVDVDTQRTGSELLERVVSMLTKMCRP